MKLWSLINYFIGSIVIALCLVVIIKRIIDIIVTRVSENMLHIISKKKFS